MKSASQSSYSTLVPVKVSPINANHNPAVKEALVILLEFPHIFVFAFCHIPRARKSSAPWIAPYNFTGNFYREKPAILVGSLVAKP